MGSKKSQHSPEQHRQVIILGWLLLLQALVMFALCLYHFSLNRGPNLLRQWLSREAAIAGQALTFQEFVNQLWTYASQNRLLLALTESVALLLLTILAISAALGFFWRWRIAWTQAMFVQGVSLLIALILYFVNKPLHIYLLMIYGIFMVIYLHYADVKVVFRE